MTLPCLEPMPLFGEHAPPVKEKGMHECSESSSERGSVVRMTMVYEALRSWGKIIEHTVV